MRRLLRRITTTGGLGAEAAAESVSDAAGSAAFVSSVLSCSVAN